MADDPNKRGPADRQRVNIHERHEVRYWCDRFGVSEEKLREAVSKAGVMVKDVEQQLARKG
jgi:hypothetical protein